MFMDWKIILRYWKIILPQSYGIAKCRWLTPVIPATQEAEIRTISAQSQPQADSSWNTILKRPIQKRLVEWLEV
jgi:hypothetical protein